MKIKFLFLAFIGFAFAKTAIPQTTQFTAEGITSVYTKDSRKALFLNKATDKDYTGSSLAVSPDGRYEYLTCRQTKDQSITHRYSQGNWKFKRSLVYFTTSSEDLNETYTVDLNDSKARLF